MLYIVSTPIGNLQDITIRAIKILFASDYIFTENIQKMSILLSEMKKRYPQLIEVPKKPKIIQFNEFTENERLYEFQNLLDKGYNISLASEAGTPLVSDPGYKLVRFATEQKIPVISIPGPTAFVPALTSSGLPTDKFLFLGFPPRTSGKKETFFKNLLESIHALDKNNMNPTIILYESPHRLLNTLQVINKIFGNIDIVIAREITKKFEETIRDNIEHIIKKYSDKEAKGEFVILFNIKF